MLSVLMLGTSVTTGGTMMPISANPYRNLQSLFFRRMMIYAAVEQINTSSATEVKVIRMLVPYRDRIFDE